MRSIEVVVIFPFAEFGFEIDVAFVRQEMVKFLLVRAMGTLDRAVQLGCSTLDKGMADALIINIPVELGLELMAVIGWDCLDPERELFDDVLADEGQKLDAHLDVMPRYLLVVAIGVDAVHARCAQRSANAVSAQNACHASVGDFDAVIARQIPNDPDRPEMILTSQVENLVDHLRRRLVDRVLHNGFEVDQYCFAALLVCGFPAIETCSAHAEVSASSGYVASLVSMAQHPQLALNISFFFGHWIHRSGCLAAI